MNAYIEAGSDFARAAHADHKRKFTGEPYWNHLHEVATTLRSYGATPDIIVSGYLHDTIEDTKVTYFDLVKKFDRNVAGLVMEVTDVSRADTGNTPEGVGNRALRKAMDRQFLAGASWQGQMIKCADMLSNTADILTHGGGFARIYIPEKKLLIDVLDKVRNVNYAIWRAAYDQIVQAEDKLRAAA
ncbi:HD domain-containing protein [Bradyrhizobium ottawaense]|uniref:HD domain-containing protein n=1 Tax=Bradyrhizobium ottawaense TaxID=931866 RepID=UPI0012FD8D7A|nr:HD domain-containing protein [Bradyrhizobium ottawaense]